MKTTIPLFLLTLLMASCELNPAWVNSAYGGKDPERCAPDWDKYPPGVFQLTSVKTNMDDFTEYDFVTFAPHEYGVISVKITTAIWYGLHVGDVVSLDAQGKFKKYPIYLTDFDKEIAEIKNYNLLEPDPELYKKGMTLANTCPNWFEEAGPGHAAYQHSPNFVTVRIEGGKREVNAEYSDIWSWILHVKGPTYENKWFYADNRKAWEEKLHIGDIIGIRFTSDGRGIVDSWGKSLDQIILPLADYNALLRDENGRLRRNEEGETMEEAYKKFSYRPWDFFPDVMYQEYWY